MAGQYGDISAFLPKDVNYGAVVNSVLDANTRESIEGWGAKALFNEKNLGSAANVKNMFFQGEIEKSKAKMQALNIVHQAKMNAPKQPKQSPLNQALGIGSQVIGIASGLGAFGGDGTFGNPFGADKDAGTAGYIDFGTGSGVNYANENGRILW